MTRQYIVTLYLIKSKVYLRPVITDGKDDLFVL